jgi:hypothetical protein
MLILDLVEEENLNFLTKLQKKAKKKQMQLLLSCWRLKIPLLKKAYIFANGVILEP